jgi:hypothetical protein
MENVRLHLHKLLELSETPQPLSVLDTDLMLDHTRRLYEALLDLRHGTTAIETGTMGVPAAAPEEVLQTVIPATEVTEVHTLAEEGSLPPEAAHPDDTRPLPAPPEPVAQPEPIREPMPQEPVKDAAQEIPFDIHVPGQQQQQQSAAQQEIVAQPLWMPELKTHPRPAAGQDIRSYISIADKYHFINELFGNNNEAYEEILDEVNNLESNTDAELFLNNSGVTTLYKWHPENDAVHLFYDTLTKFFAVR